MSYAKIQTTAEVSREHFTKVEKQWDKDRTVLQAAHGRPPKIKPEMVHAIEFEAVTTPDISARQLASKMKEVLGVEISQTTVDRIRHSLHFNFLPKVNRSALSDDHVRMRYQFSEDILHGEDAEMWG
jgi:transposase